VLGNYDPGYSSRSFLTVRREASFGYYCIRHECGYRNLLTKAASRPMLKLWILATTTSHPCSLMRYRVYNICIFIVRNLDSCHRFCQRFMLWKHHEVVENVRLYCMSDCNQKQDAPIKLASMKVFKQKKSRTI
jgi:hypothetical protein